MYYEKREDTFASLADLEDDIEGEKRKKKEKKYPLWVSFTLRTVLQVCIVACVAVVVIVPVMVTRDKYRRSLITPPDRVRCLEDQDCTPAGSSRTVLGFESLQLIFELRVSASSFDGGRSALRFAIDLACALPSRVTVHNVTLKDINSCCATAGSVCSVERTQTKELPVIKDNRKF
ncbi:uncharacterized protein LOC125036958 [Penaeus chinensis]|uniref:uncharacterized protein LOC125036958 n=1 Tax=Penaeus chinensis TaxID=139456 RepID=UPI001FB707E0|nr:uncharacterized protein LOC125036958 [Penaeus chinensis]